MYLNGRIFSLCVLCMLFFPFSAKADTVFDLMDSNKNGELTYEEFSALNSHIPKVLYEQMDTDKSGFLTVEEWEGFLSIFGTAGGILLGPVTSTPLTPQTEAIEPLAPKEPTIPGPLAPMVPMVGNLTLPDVVLTPSRGSLPPQNSTKK